MSDKAAYVLLSLGLLIAGALGVLALTGGGNRRPATEAAEPEAKKEVFLELVAEDNSFEPTTLEFTSEAEVLRIQFTNEGSTKHTFAIARLFDTGPLAPGESKNVVLADPPQGETEFFCSIHRDEGMTGHMAPSADD